MTSMLSESSMLIVHLFATLFMTGLIWFVQVVHYPLFARLSAESAVAYEHEHMKRTNWVVAPVMLAEVASAVLLVVVLPSSLAVAGLLMLVGIWVSTAVFQIPCHQRLSEGFDVDVVRRLVGTNWIRTWLWTGRSVIAIVLFGSGHS